MQELKKIDEAITLLGAIRNLENEKANLNKTFVSKFKNNKKIQEIDSQILEFSKILDNLGIEDENHCKAKSEEIKDKKSEVNKMKKDYYKFDSAKKAIDKAKIKQKRVKSEKQKSNNMII